MHIIHLSSSFAPARGGVETHVAAVAQEQAERGHKVQVLTRAADGFRLITIDKDGNWRATKQEMRLVPRELSKLETWRKVGSFLGRLRQADVLQVHDIFWWIVPFLPWLQGQHIITTFHGWEGYFPVRWQAKLQRRLYSWLSHKTVHVGAWIKTFYGDTPDAVIYGATNQSHRPPTMGSAGSQHKLVFVGRLEKENDIELYLEFIRQLQKKHTFHMTWVGDGTYRDACQELGTVTGMVNDVALYLDQATVVMAASYLSIIEAQAKAKVVVALYSHALKEQYLKTYPGKEGMIIGETPKKVVVKVNQLLENPAALAEKSRTAELAVRHLTWDNVADIYESLMVKL